MTCLVFITRLLDLLFMIVTYLCAHTVSEMPNVMLEKGTQLISVPKKGPN